MAQLELRQINKSFGDASVIQNIDLHVADGEFCVFVGPSGCGKSTLLRLIAGLEESTSGTISIGGNDVTALQPARRGIAMVFQSYALYPHMTVRQNMGFALRLARVPEAERERKVLIRVGAKLRRCVRRRRSQKRLPRFSEIARLEQREPAVELNARFLRKLARGLRVRL